MQSDTLTYYTRELNKSKYNPLSPEEERKLLEQYAAGSMRAFERLVETHLRFVVYFIRYYKIPNNVDIMDIVQEGNAGLIVGIKRFNNKRTNRVFTYAMYWIRFYMSTALNINAKNHNIFVPLPEEVYELAQEKENRINERAIREDITNELIGDTFNILDSKEKAIIMLFYGIGSSGSKTLKEIGSMLHVTAENIRLIKLKAIEKIKQHLKETDTLEKLY
jgi:RNA polymerase sigma factor (sigma-70 family)